MNYKDDLTQKLISYARSYGETHIGEDYIHPNENTNSSIIFNQIEYNFHPKSWERICQIPIYKHRTLKKHTNTVTKGLFEMQSSNSSDALAMNIFCNPSFKNWKGVQKVFGVKSFGSIEFGYKPKVNKLDEDHNVIGDATEVDVRVNQQILIECKLTEDGFYKKPKEEVEKYVEFENVFHAKKLINKSGSYLNYQLIRNILAAYQLKCRFILICDMRRPDLVKNFYQTIRCIKDEHIDLRLSCDIIFWQDIAKKCGAELKFFLKEKYRIC